MTCGERNEDCTHPKAGRRSECRDCGEMSHHYAATVRHVKGQATRDDRAYAVPVYCGAGDPTGIVNDVEVNPFDWKDGALVSVSWCCGAEKGRR